MLDDSSYLARFDSDDALGVEARQFEQLGHQFALKVAPDQSITRIVVAGMGGSALAAQFIPTWPQVMMPFAVVRDYQLPAWVDEHTLVIASSYSGNTEEVISALSQAKQQGAQIAIVTAGGQLASIAQREAYPCAQLPSGLQPRMALWYNFKALVSLLEAYGLVEGSVAELEATAGRLKEVPYLWQASVPTEQNLAKQLAEYMVGKTPIIYAGPLLYPVAYTWKIDCNENAKNTAWCGEYPEFNHNEFLGWSSHPIEKPFAVIDLRSSLDHPQTRRRFGLSDRLLSGRRPKAWPVAVEGETILEQLLWSVALGGTASVYLALLNGLNPTPVDLLEHFKEALAKPTAD